MKRLLIIGLVLLTFICSAYATIDVYNVGYESVSSNSSIFFEQTMTMDNISTGNSFVYINNLNYTATLNSLQVSMDYYNHSTANTEINVSMFPRFSSYSDNLYRVVSSLAYDVNATLTFNVISKPSEVQYYTQSGAYDVVYGPTDFVYVDDTKTLTLNIVGIENTSVNTIIIIPLDTGGTTGGGGGGGGTTTDDDDDVVDNTDDTTGTDTTTDDGVDNTDDTGTVTSTLRDCDFDVQPKVIYIYDNHTSQDVTISNNEDIELNLKYSLNYVNGDQFLHTTLGLSNAPSKLKAETGSVFKLFINDFLLTSGQAESELIITSKQCSNKLVVPVNTNINDKGNIVTETTKDIVETDYIMSAESFFKKLADLSFRDSVPENQSGAYYAVNFLITTVLGLTIILSMLSAIFILPESDTGDYYSSSIGERILIWIVVSIVIFFVLLLVHWVMGML